MRKSLLAMLIAIVMVLSACAEQPAKKEENPAASPETSEATAAVSDGVDDARVQEILAQFPESISERVATTSVPVAEMLHLLGITPVGVPTSTNPIPAAFDQVERIGSPMQPDLEVVTALKSDLLIGAESLRSTLEKTLEGIELQTSYLPTDSFADLKLSFKVLGTYFNKQEEMNTKLQSITDKEVELQKLTEGKELPSVMLVIGTAESFMVMSEKSYLGSLVGKLGADNIATSALKVTDTYSPINMENIVAADPDIILVLASGDHGATADKFNKEIEKNEVWTKLSAYQNKKIHMLDYSTFGVTSIINVEKALTDISQFFIDK
ncbi:ABC transporter substrate-binding protein [Paenibacillus yanchengensis]|uniref:ABC transporter substrate-binding protein n=1 Tax=Paenibacillus yanchengensis TaxID=2035833 RepID=A0ABW4YJZ6_9BACL